MVMCIYIYIHIYIYIYTYILKIDRMILTVPESSPPKSAESQHGDRL